MVACISWYKLMKTFVKYLNIICFNLIFLRKKSYEFLILLQNHAWINICKVLRTIVVAYITIIPNHCKYSYYLKDMNLFKLKRNSIRFYLFFKVIFTYIVYFSNWKTQVFYISFNLHNRDNVIPFKINSS